MKSTITPAPKTPAVNSYPCLKQWKNSKGFVVLFTAKDMGMVVSSSADWKIGHLCGHVAGESWCESEFIPFNGSITLSNN